MKSLPLLASALALAMLAGCPSGTDLPQKPQIEPDVTELNFGAPFYGVCVGAEQPGTVQLRNGGKEDLVISKVEITGTNAGLFSLYSPKPDVPQFPMTVTSETSGFVTLIYAPTARGKHSARLEITSNAENQPKLTIPMSPIAADKTDDADLCNPPGPSP
jgi:hypothetical protein